MVVLSPGVGGTRGVTTTGEKASARAGLGALGGPTGGCEKESERAETARLTSLLLLRGVSP